ncbi:hypothetical protein BDV12DRAFT_206405 [Aspergillus spectabilis]
MSFLNETQFVPLTPPIPTPSLNEAKTGGTIISIHETTPPSSVPSIASTTDTALPPPSTGVEQANATPITYTPLISERAVDQARPLKVIYIGAGVSGILAAIKFREAVPDLDLTIYEKNPDLGGTWFENRYPGCACDVPSHSYQLSFESWTGWSQFFSGSDEILEYWNLVAAKYDVRQYIKFQSRCVGARWNDSLGKWFVQIFDESTGQVFEDSADVFMTGTGLLNEWKWPGIPGLHTFKGKLLHSASWDESYDIQNKTVAVIGAGSSGIQIVPALLPKITSMDHYIRGKTWISNQHGGERLAARTNNQGGNFTYTDAERQSWRERRLHAKPELLDHLLPDFPPLCKRLTPGPGYLEALTDEKVNLVTNPIATVNETGVVTADGTHRPVDAIICATGFETNPGGGFPIFGRNGVNLREKYNGFPNFFQSLGPNSFQGAGNLLITMEQAHSYFAGILSRMAYDNIGLVEPKRAEVERFTGFCEKYFERTVYSAECASWYKSSPPGTTLEGRKKGRVTALWPGSSLHCLKAWRRVRWEDYELRPYDGNAFGWFGNGWTLDERRQEVDARTLTGYLARTEFLDEVEIKK